MEEKKLKQKLKADLQTLAFEHGMSEDAVNHEITTKKTLIAWILENPIASGAAEQPTKKVTSDAVLQNKDFDNLWCIREIKGGFYASHQVQKEKHFFITESTTSFALKNEESVTTNFATISEVYDFISSL